MVPVIYTCQELLEEFLFSRIIRKDTVSSYRKAINKLQTLLNEHQGMDIHSIEPKLLLTWRRKELNRGLAYVSWNTYIRHLKAIFNYGIEHNLLHYPKNPFLELTVPVPKKKKKTITEFSIVLAREYLEETQAKDQQGQPVGKLHPVWFWRTVFETFYYTGIRRNQLIHLRLRDVDLRNQLINIRFEGSKTHREYQVPICDSLLPWLENIIQIAVRKGFNKDDQLFNVNRYTLKARKNLTKEMTLDRVSNVFQSLSIELSSRITPHRFRHTLGTDLMKDPDRNLHLVKDLMGHTNLKTTLEYIETDISSIKQILDTRNTLKGRKFSQV
ncbi:MULTISPECIES: tyrosine-type recombinase/integrase [Entomomonas]|uniref:Site-specific integrase n=1 Tax=Entomomonas asaccharolytica TaxID=2785331 RepID=A0A974NHS5_9GAMM|nr:MULTISPECIES: site-specific integrase [Entomomonas]QQP86893.1 site-specific integrase [Entomomonas asaccharolytica]UYZ83487.1 tyrosine-type recombinase/integrase [Entomomonas sp. E2T0]